MVTIYELQAEICQALAHPKRLELLHLLRQGELPLTEILDSLAISKANLSQHLSVLKRQELVSLRREKGRVYCSLVSGRVGQACDLMRQMLFERMTQHAEIAEELDDAAPLPS